MTLSRWSPLVGILALPVDLPRQRRFALAAIAESVGILAVDDAAGPGAGGLDVIGERRGRNHQSCGASRDHQFFHCAFP